MINRIGFREREKFMHCHNKCCDGEWGITPVTLETKVVYIHSWNSLNLSPPDDRGTSHKPSVTFAGHSLVIIVCSLNVAKKNQFVPHMHIRPILIFTSHHFRPWYWNGWDYWFRAVIFENCGMDETKTSTDSSFLLSSIAVAGVAITIREWPSTENLGTCVMRNGSLK